MKQTIRLNETQFNRLVKESVKRVLKECAKKTLSNKFNINEWSFTDWGYMPDIEDWTMVNDESCGKKLYKVGIWCGSGYVLNMFRAWANDEEEALDYVIAWLDKSNDMSLFVDDEVEEEYTEGYKEGKSYEEIDNKVDDWAMYIDATEYGAREPHYIFSENLTVQEFPKEYLERGRDTNAR